ncbi:MAG: LacI family DNA-binding transcriptional regulator [Caldilineaceae bacterium]|nr:LacI family DNA-binding transcriptional regulator [Caldilineaceae bacterium]
MDDIAKQAEVSKSTVSLVLNEKPGVSAELKEVVLRAATELGYQLPKQRSARRTSAQLPTQFSMAVVHAQSSPPVTTNQEPTELFLNYLKGIRTFAQEANVHLTLLTDYNEEDASQLAFQLLHNSTPPFDGLILMGGSARQNNQLITQIIADGKPAVALSRSWPDLPISTVGPDYRQQVRIAMDYLAGLGHQRIAFVASTDDRRFDWYRWRLEAYRQAMQRINGAVDEGLIAVGRNGAEAITTLLQTRRDVTACFAINDERAHEVLTGLQKLHLQVPHDLSLIGQDNVTERMGNQPMLTTVGFSHVDVGYLAAELLAKQMQNETISHCNLWVQCTLVERTSCRELAP